MHIERVHRGQVRHCWRVLNTILNTTTVKTVHLGRQSKAVGFFARQSGRRESGIRSHGDILGPASCRKQYANVAKNATVATPHCPLAMTCSPLCSQHGPARNRESVLQLDGQNAAHQEFGFRVPRERCALIESFAIHFRNLFEFFYNQSPKHSDVVAADFFDDPAAWSVTPSSGW
jgi:hypothetical protein